MANKTCCENCGKRVRARAQQYCHFCAKELVLSIWRADNKLASRQRPRYKLALPPDATYTMSDVLGFLGISYERQNELCKQAGIEPNRDRATGRLTRYYTPEQFERFLNAAGYRFMRDNQEEWFLVHESKVKEWPRPSAMKCRQGELKNGG